MRRGGIVLAAGAALALGFACGGSVQNGTPAECRSTVETNVACSTSGLQCAASSQLDCVDGGPTRWCTCNGARWSCEPYQVGGCDPAPSCPAVVQDGASCSGTRVCLGAPMPDCQGRTVTPSCACQSGRWVCPRNACVSDAAPPNLDASND